DADSRHHRILASRLLSGCGRPTMTPIGRRTMLEGSALSAAAFAFGAVETRGSAGVRIAIGLIGAGGMGSNHLRLLAGRRDVEISYVCDVDRGRLGEATSIVERSATKAPKAVSDLRRVLDDRDVEAVWIATPDHWHAPAAILALQAGKHVYVEKPCCH